MVAAVVGGNSTSGDSPLRRQSEEEQIPEVTKAIADVTARLDQLKTVQ